MPDFHGESNPSQGSEESVERSETERSLYVKGVEFWTRDPNPCSDCRGDSGTEDKSDCPTELVAKATFFLSIFTFLTFLVLLIGDTLKPWGPWHFPEDLSVGMLIFNIMSITFVYRFNVH